MKTFCLAILLTLFASLAGTEEQLLKPDVSKLVGHSVITCTGSALHVPKLDGPNIDWTPELLGSESVRPFKTAIITRAELGDCSYGACTIRVLLKVPDGKQGVVTMNLGQSDWNADGAQMIEAMLTRSLSRPNLLHKLPVGLKDGDVVRLQPGIHRTALACLMGEPDRINDYGNGGTQWVYAHGKILVYFRPGSRLVSDVQQF